MFDSHHFKGYHSKKCVHVSQSINIPNICIDVVRFKSFALLFSILWPFLSLRQSTLLRMTSVPLTGSKLFTEELTYQKVLIPQTNKKSSHSAFYRDIQDDAMLHKTVAATPYQLTG